MLISKNINLQGWTLLRITSDQSIFAFEQSSGSRDTFNLLAESPDSFEGSSDIILTPPIRKGQFQVIGKEIHFSRLTIDPNRHRSWTSLGIRWKKRGSRFKAVLDCCPEYDGTKLVVLNFHSDDRDMSYVRLESDVNRMERVAISAIRKGPVQRETLKVMQNSDDHSSNRHWITVRCLITGTLSVTPDVVPNKSIWIKDSNTLTIPCSNQIGLWSLKQIPELSLFISLDNDRNQSRLRFLNGQISVENGFLGRWSNISRWGDCTVMWYKGGALIVTLLRDGPSLQRQDIVILELHICGPVKGMLHSANLAFDRFVMRMFVRHETFWLDLGMMLGIAAVIGLLWAYHPNGIRS